VSVNLRQPKPIQVLQQATISRMCLEMAAIIPWHSMESQWRALVICLEHQSICEVLTVAILICLPLTTLVWLSMKKTRLLEKSERMERWRNNRAAHSAGRHDECEAYDVDADVTFDEPDTEDK
jgi:predicted DCC family thiol-disulfide oxidoreductase YuxK